MPSEALEQEEIAVGDETSGTDVRTNARRVNRRGMAKLLIFVLVNAVGLTVALMAAAKMGEQKRYPVGKSESVLLTMPEDTHFDVLVVGPSHAQEFAWSGNHERVEGILGADVANLSSEGTGPVPVDIFWQMWRERGNSAGTVVYFAHPFAFYSSRFNEDNRFTGKEPLDPTLLGELVARGFGTDNVMFYIQSKFNPEWIAGKARGDNADIEVDAGPVSPELHDAAVANLYPDGTDGATFERYAAVFDATVRDMRAAGTNVVIVVPPTLMGEPKGMDRATAHVEELAAADEGIVFLDLTGKVEDHSLFMDLSHLNTRGVELVTEEYLAPLLRPSE
ncbi:MAG: hypothetical protein IT198_05910 [Acidimicrobiia bacterium]|nr:hypothetical protein [Acidimicrobiia bacterium]